MDTPNSAETDPTEELAVVVETLDLHTVVLGMRPYVLVELEPDPEAGLILRASIHGGGGVRTQGDILKVVTLTLAALSGIEPDSLTQIINTCLEAQGREPMAPTE